MARISSMHTVDLPAVDVLYYDGRCPLCRREMVRLARLKDDRLELRDIHTLGEAVDPLFRRALLQQLHLRRADGTWLSGLDANLAAWDHTALGACFRWLRWPGLRAFSDRLYRYWALWRYRRLYGDADEGGGSRCLRSPGGAAPE
jgi:predicted DCC family thiol-disulfide oxidoreductase YuxK